jgi:phospholipid N-methyltransferase
MSHIPLTEGRRSFGDDPIAYATARPEYPEACYRHLVDRCGLRAGTVAFEVGAGTGLATRRLLELGVASLLAIEPDPRLAAFLRETISGNGLADRGEAI